VVRWQGGGDTGIRITSLAGQSVLLNRFSKAEFAPIIHSGFYNMNPFTFPIVLQFFFSLRLFTQYMQQDFTSWAAIASRTFVRGCLKTTE